MNSTTRKQVATALRSAAAKLIAGANDGEMGSFVQSYNFAKTKSLDPTQVAQFINHLDRVVAEFSKREVDTDEMYKLKDSLDTAQKLAKMATKAADAKEAARLAHRAYSKVADASLRLMNLERRSQLS